MRPDPNLPVVHADESDSTGENLTDQRQQIYTHAAIHVADQTAAALTHAVVSALPRGHGEPKYAALAKTGRGRALLLEVLGPALLAPDTVRVYVIHKRYMAVTKMVDLLVEEAAHASGLNLYEDQVAPRLAQLLYLIGSVPEHRSHFDVMVDAFVAATRRRSRASVDDLFGAVDLLVRSVEPGFRPTLGLLLACRPYADDLVARVQAGELIDMLEPAVPAVIMLCEAWAAALGPFRLIHDRSAAIERNLPRFLSMHQFRHPAEPDRNMARFGARMVEFADSASLPQLQLADWIAGAARQWARSLLPGGTTEPFASRLDDIV